MTELTEYEILAPCGSPEAVYGAAAADCDSIYIGAKAYNARALARNFENEEIKQIIDFCHLRGVKVYITFNILYKDAETEDLLKSAAELYSYGADAFICADIGIMQVFKEYFKGLKINASTQTTVHNSDTALAFKEMGVDRIVLSRELSLKDIRAVYEKTGNKPDLEAFVHGALCVCYSGRCLYSSFVGGRSGNKGRCAQPCRMEYSLLREGKEIAKVPLLSPKDIMTAEHIYDMIRAGVKAFKIEGRMKSVPYVFETVKTYKKYLEAAVKAKTDSKITLEDKNNLLQVFSRGGEFSEGYLYTPKGKDMLSENVKNSGREIGFVTASDKKGCYIKFFEALHCGDGIEIFGRNQGTGISKKINRGQTAYFNLKGKKGDRVFLSYDKALTDSLNREAALDSGKREIEGSFKARLGERTELSLKTKETEVTVLGEKPQKAENRPTSKEEIISRLSKTGNTPFKTDKLTVRADDDIYIPVKELNALRREACDKLSEEIVKSYERKAPALPPKPVLEKTAEKPFISAEVTRAEQLKAVLKSNIKRIYINDISLVKEALGVKDKEIFYALPHIVREESLERVFEEVKSLENTEITGFLTRNPTMLKTGKKIICDHTLGVFNSYTAERLLKDYSGITLSTELDLKELKPLCAEGSEIIVYGRLPLMTTEQCPIGNFVGNNRGKRFCSLKNRAGGFSIKDRTGALYPLEPCCEACFCKILSSEPVFAPEALNLKPSSFRLIFTMETEEETVKITDYFTDMLKNTNINKPTDIKGRSLKGVR
ncbi:MAG: U32 family peptidase [Clostridiales bacterium]|nr:U32 family peptidase [Clostridiales bacterium]